MRLRVLVVLSVVGLGVLLGARTVGAQGGDPIRHVVQQGETLSAIAGRYNVALPQLLAANHLSDPDRVLVGSVLVIPPVDPGGAAPPGDHPRHEPGAGQVVAILGPDELVQRGFVVGSPVFLTNSHWRDSDRPLTEEERAARDLREAIFAADPAAAQWLITAGIYVPGDARIRAIYRRGLAMGNNPRAFSKIGDCNSEPPNFLTPFDEFGTYDLGPYDFLLPLITYFRGSFGRASLTVWTGNTAWGALDPTWANPAECTTGETPLACELRHHRPSFVLIRLGTNEAGYPEDFEANLRTIIEYAAGQGVVPILGTKADQREGSDQNNAIVRRLASEYGLPLWDFGRLAASLPEGGLMPDGFHMTLGAPYFGDPVALQTGHTMQNLSALVVLNAVVQAVSVPG